MGLPDPAIALPQDDTGHVLGPDPPCTGAQVFCMGWEEADSRMQTIDPTQLVALVEGGSSGREGGNGRARGAKKDWGQGQSDQNPLGGGQEALGGRLPAPEANAIVLSDLTKHEFKGTMIEHCISG